jgi:hypothetical protein
MRGFTAEVKKMYLVYDNRNDLVPPAIRKFIVDVVEKAADGHPVEVQFLQ